MASVESLIVAQSRLHSGTKDALLYTYVLAAPFFLFSIAFGRDTAAMWVLACMVVLGSMDVIISGWKIWIDRSYIPLAVLLAAYCASTLNVYLQDPATTLLGRTPLDRAISTDIRLFFVLTAFAVFVHYLVDAPASTFRKIYRLQIAVGVILAIVGVLQFLAHELSGPVDFLSPEPTNEAFVGFRAKRLILVQRGVFRTTSIFKEPSFFGFFLVPLATKALVGWRERVFVGSRTTHIIAGSILVIALLTSLSLSAIIAIVIVFGAYAISMTKGQKRSTGLLAIIGIALASGAIFVLMSGGVLGERLSLVTELRDGSTLDRVIRVYGGFMVFADNPILGVGPGGFAFHYLHLGGFDTTTLVSPLNIWITILTDVGIIGLVSFLGFLFITFRRAISYMHEDPLVPVYAWSVFAYPVLLTTLDFWFVEFFWFELAMLVTICVRAQWRSEAVAPVQGT